MRSMCVPREEMDGDTKGDACHQPRVQLTTGRPGRVNHLQFSETPHRVLGEAGIGLELRGPLQPVFLGRAVSRKERHLSAPILSPSHPTHPGSQATVPACHLASQTRVTSGGHPLSDPPQPLRSNSRKVVYEPAQRGRGSGWGERGPRSSWCGLGSWSFEQSGSPGLRRRVSLTRPRTGPCWGLDWVGTKGHTPQRLWSLETIALFIGVTSAHPRALTSGLGLEAPQIIPLPLLRSQTARLGPWGPLSPCLLASEHPGAKPACRQPCREPSHFLEVSLWRSREYLRSRVQCSCSFTFFSSFWNLWATQVEMRGSRLVPRHPPAARLQGPRGRPWPPWLVCGTTVSSGLHLLHGRYSKHLYCVTTGPVCCGRRPTEGVVPRGTHGLYAWTTVSHVRMSTPPGSRRR